MTLPVYYVLVIFIGLIYILTDFIYIYINFGGVTSLLYILPKRSRSITLISNPSFHVQQSKFAFLYILLVTYELITMWMLQVFVVACCMLSNCKILANYEVISSSDQPSTEEEVIRALV